METNIYKHMTIDIVVKHGGAISCNYRLHIVTEIHLILVIVGSVMHQIICFAGHHQTNNILLEAVMLFFHHQFYALLSITINFMLDYTNLTDVYYALRHYEAALRGVENWHRLG